MLWFKFRYSKSKSSVKEKITNKTQKEKTHMWQKQTLHHLVYTKRKTQKNLSGN